MPKTVLIAEDNERNLKLFKFLVISLGHEVLEAWDGEEAVRLAREKTPDLILMDIQMPRMDGITAMKLLRMDERTMPIPVLALTSYAMKGDRERLLEAGFRDYIPKPIDKQSFLACLEQYLKG